jgi:hypothetical protein
LASLIVEELSPVPTEPLDVLEVVLAQPPLQGPDGENFEQTRQSVSRSGNLFVTYFEAGFKDDYFVGFRNKSAKRLLDTSVFTSGRAG